MQTAERDLRGGDQAQVGILDAVNLRFRAAWNESDPFEHFLAGDVRGDHRRISFLHKQPERILDQAQLQEDRFILEEVEFLAGD